MQGSCNRALQKGFGIYYRLPPDGFTNGISRFSLSRCHVRKKFECFVLRNLNKGVVLSRNSLNVPGMGETLWLVNDHPVEKIEVHVTLPSQRCRQPWQGIRKGLDPLAEADHLRLVLPGMSLTSLTTLKE